MPSAQQLAKHVSKHDLVATLDVIGAAAQVGTQQQFTGLMQRLFEVLPIERADVCVAEIGADHAIVRTSRHVSFNYPPQWVTLYRTRGYHRVDPVARHLFAAQKPLYWSELRARHQSRAEREFYGAAATYGLKDGVSFGTRFDNSTAGSYFSFAGPELGCHVRHRQLFDYLTPHLHEAVSRMHMSHQREKPRLTPRELEVLTWAKYGKTNADIAVLLAVTPRAVTFHLENAMRKLDVVNRTQATAVALSLGLIRWS